MGHIKEPEGIDLNIKSKPLTDKDRKEISEYIAKSKAKRAKEEKAAERKAS